MPLDFKVNLDALTTLRHALATLADDVTAGPAGQSHPQNALTPRTTPSASTTRANSDTLAAFAYGLLHESSALGQAHEEVTQTVHALVAELHTLIGELEAHAARGAEHYASAEATVLSAVREVEGGLA